MSSWTVTNFVTPLIQPEAEIIILFSFPDYPLSDSQSGKHLAFNRYTYSGECIGAFRPFFSGLNKMLLWHCLNSFVPVNYNGSLLAMRINSLSEQRGDISCLLRFNEKANDLRVWEGSKLTPNHRKDEYGAMAWWNDTCYGFKAQGSDTEPRDLIAYMGTADTKSYRPIVSSRKSNEIVRTAANVFTPIMANGKYAIRIVDSCAYVLCFDDDDNNGRRPRKNGPFFDIGEVEVLTPSRNRCSSGIMGDFAMIQV